MENEPNQLGDVNSTEKRLPKIVWLPFAFLPSIIAIAGIRTSLFIFSLTILNAFCSFLSASKLLRMSQGGVFSALGLGLGLFILNVFISVFVGCTLQ